MGAVCSAADGVSAYADGTVDSDGCSIPPQSTADAACVAPLAPTVDCGGYTCSLDPGAGSGCVLTAGPASNADCLDGLANCQTSTCSAEGACSAPTAIVGFCECAPPAPEPCLTTGQCSRSVHVCCIAAVSNARVCALPPAPATCAVSKRALLSAGYTSPVVSLNSACK